MSISVGVEYALHCLIYLAIPTTSRSIGIKEMAAFQGISETYLSKIFMKLRKKDLYLRFPVSREAIAFPGKLMRLRFGMSWRPSRGPIIGFNVPKSGSIWPLWIRTNCRLPFRNVPA